MKKIHPLIIIGFFLSISFPVFSQHLMGKIVEKDDQGKYHALPMAGIKWHGTAITATSDENGSFHIAFPDSMPAKLIVSMIGYKNDTVLFREKSLASIQVILKSAATTLTTVNITGKQQSTSNLISAPINTELISRKELTLAACCNLSESFERNASVDVNFTDAVSGTKQIQMLGLDGIYTQILYENLPFVHGLSSSYGLSYIPGPWVESILVTKGTGSVVNGYESITGQIQIELLEPDKADKFFINGYANSEQRYEFNAHYAKQFNENLSTLLFAHAGKNSMKVDRNGDSFHDMPLTTQYNFLNRWHYRIKDKAEGQFGFRGLIEDRLGGQMFFDHRKDFSGQTAYGIGIGTKQFESFTKNGFMFPDKPWKSIAIMTTERYHKQTAFFGMKRYSGEQKSLYVNTIWQDIINTTFHKIKFGVSVIADDFAEKFNNNIPAENDSVFSKRETIPGGYFEYTYNNDSNISIVGGLRADFLDDFGFTTNPRIHIKYNPEKGTVFRLSGGRGFRTTHIFAENSQVFASSRKLVIKEILSPEIAWNYGATFTQKFKVASRDASFNVDFFRTDFQNQVVVDLENPDEVQFYNLKGKSFSNSLQADFSFQPIERLDVKFAYKHYEVKTTYLSSGSPSGSLLDKPFVPKDRALVNIDYATNLEKWMFDLTVKWFGESRLPNTSPNLPEFVLPQHAPAYYTLFAQVTKRFRVFELYVGGENLLDYRQANPILDPENPFGPNFDASMIWGPVNGRVIYGGFRFKVGK